jgi:coproporphyrinogen III oxidase-like Fe-S oxidoreductase
MGLRLTAGIDRDLFARITGRALDDCIDQAQLPALEAAGLVVADAQSLRVTAAGLQRLNAIIAAIAA